MASDALLRALAAQVGQPHVLARPADLAAYAFDAFGASGDRFLPSAVVFPGSTEEVSEVVQVCAEAGVPVVPRGAGTGYSGGAVARHGGVVVDLCRLDRILGIEPDAMRLHAEAGVVTAAIHRAAASVGLYYPPDPGSSTTCTIGGNVACNAAGPHALRYGVTADYVVGATAVLGDGRIVRLGEGSGDGTDLLRLLVGSEGTLGIVTEVLLRLLPAPAARTTLAAAFPSMDGAFAAVAAIDRAGLVPAALEFLDDAALRAIARSGVDCVAPDAGALVLVEVEGDPATVAAEASTVRSVVETAGADRVVVAGDAHEAERLWRARKAISAAVATVMIGKVNEDVAVPRDRIAEAVAATHRIGEAHRLPVVNFGHLGDGNLHATFLLDPRRPQERQRADAAANELCEEVVAMGGTITAEHGVGYVKLAHVERQVGAETVALMRRIKAALDPQGILNPGKKVP